ncbi:MAG: DNA polymerase II [Planctomycetota bacterium]
MDGTGSGRLHESRDGIAEPRAAGPTAAYTEPDLRIARVVATGARSTSESPSFGRPPRELAVPSPDRAFLLDASHRIEQGRTILQLWGRLASGESVLVRDDRARPGFWVPRDAALPPEVEAYPTGEQTLRGEEVLRVDLPTPAEVDRFRRWCEDHDVTTYEADVRTAVAELVATGIRSTFEIHGDHRPGERVDRIYDNPELRPCEFVPKLRVVSFDLETDRHGNEILSAAITDGTDSLVILRCDDGLDCPKGVIEVRNERELLIRFAVAIREFDPDVITGWNINEFDLPVLDRVAKRLRQPLELGRTHGAIRISPQGHVTIPGRVVLDGIRLLRGAFVRMESYALDAVARSVLGVGKTVTASDRAAEILRMFREDRPKFVEYNLRDAELVLEILDRLELMDLTIERSRITGMTPDRVTSSTGAFDYLYLSELRKRARVASTTGRGPSGEDPVHGAEVFEPTPGLHPNVWVFDFKSLYPSIIRTFQIDPLGHVPEPVPDGDWIVAPNGACFRREPGILPGILDELFPRREEAKQAGNPVASQAIKILMNSFYGVLGASTCRFHSTALSNAITAFGRELLNWSKDRCEEIGHRVLYGDTDSLFVASGIEDPAEAQRRGEELVEQLNRDVATLVKKKWKVESRRELEFEKQYVKLHLQHMRGRTEGARKRYVGAIETEDGLEVIYTGVEAVRRDWTDLARRLQREMYERLFHDLPVIAYLRDVVQGVRAGEHDEALIYRKALRKKPEEYISTTPPHVAAARKMEPPLPRVIPYVMTVHGPEPIIDDRFPNARLDYDHYLEKQVRPIAEPVLELHGTDFASIAGGGQQLELF